MSLTKVSYAMIQNDPINVKDLGAVGNGTTDDTAAIQAAITAAEANLGGVIYLPVGNYVVSSTLTMSADCPIFFQGDGKYESSKGTRIKWMGGNSTSVFSVKSFNSFSNFFIYKGNSATSVTAFNCIGVLATPKTSLIFSNVQVKGFATGWAFEYSYYNSLKNCTASYCTLGYDIRTEANVISFENCTSSANATGITDKNGSGAYNILWSNGSFELNTVVALDFSVTNNSGNFSFICTYFESNYKTATIATKFIRLQDCLFNHEAVSGGVSARPAITLSGSRGVYITNYLSSSDITNFISFTGIEANYAKQSVFLDKPYANNVFANDLYASPDSFTLGYLNPSSYQLVESASYDVSIATTNPVILAVGEYWKTSSRKIVAVKLVVEIGIAITGGSFTVGIGRNAGYVDTATQTFTTNLASGVYDIPLVSGAPINAAATTPYRISHTTETSGNFKIVLCLA